MLKEFETYLHKCEYAESTVVSYCKVVHKFVNWCNRNDVSLESIDYKTWIVYQELIQGRTTKKGLPLKDNSVRQDIGAVRLFFDFLVHKDILSLNPIKEIHYKDNSKFFHTQLSQYELEDLYYRFPTENLNHPNCPSVAIRNKVIIGLVVYQAIDSKTLKSLNVSNIDLNRAEVYVPSNIRSNSRTLSLEPHQISVLKEYLELHRPILQKKINCFTEVLFPLNTRRFSIITSDISKKLKQLNLKVTNLLQIRNSVIKLWTKKYDLRRVQIMAGHRYISSTEKYYENDRDELHEATQRYHPMM